MDVSDLLLEVESLSFKQRMSRMVELGRLSLSDPLLAATLTTMGAGDFYTRYLALQACYGSRDGSYVLQAVSDPSLIMRKSALALVPLVCASAQISEALVHVTLEQRVPLLRRLHKHHLQQPIDDFLISLADLHLRDLQALLSYGSPALVTRYLDQVVPRFTLTNWRRLARRHPAVALAKIGASVASSQSLDQLLLQRINAILPILVDRAPDDLLTFVATLSPKVSLNHLALQPLIAKRPREMFIILRKSQEPTKFDLSAILHQLSFEQLTSLVKNRHTATHAYKKWLPALTSDQRLELYTQYLYTWRNKDGQLDLPILEYLPTAQRALEGRRHLALPVLVGNDGVRITYAAFLPWSEMLSVLRPYLRDADADIRAAALRTLTTAVRYQRAYMDEMLSLFLDHRYEPDNVRQTMLAGLDSIPPSCWQVAHIAQLAEMIRSSLDAIDMSQQSTRVFLHLLVRLIPFHPLESVQQLIIIMLERLEFAAHDVDDDLNDAQVRFIAPLLQPVFVLWEEQVRDYPLLQVAGRFARRLPLLVDLLPIIERVARKTRNSQNADTVLALFIQWAPERAATLIPALLQEDPSWITLSSVSDYLNQQRQDLLTPFLAKRTIQGRFSKDETRFTLLFDAGFQRWTREQQAIFAHTQEQLIDESLASASTNGSAIERLASLPAVPPIYLQQLVQNSMGLTKNTALLALSRLDTDAGLPLLIAELDGDSARVAIYLLGRLLRRVDEHRALALLRAVSMKKVTVAKEVVRLLGSLHFEASYLELQRLTKLDLHPDIHAAIIRALWDYLDRPETWDIFTRLADHPTSSIILALCRISTAWLTPVEHQRFFTILRTLLRNPEPKLRIELLTLCQSLLIYDEQQILTPILLQSLSLSFEKEYTRALNSFLAIATIRDIPLVQSAFLALVPDRKKLQTIVDKLSAVVHLYRKKPQYQPIVWAMLEVLASDALTINLRVYLACRTLAITELSQFLQQVVVRNEMLPDALSIVCDCLESSSSHLTLSGMEQLEALLANQRDPLLRRIALSALLAQISRWRRGAWTEAAVARLYRYQQDSSLLVAGKAQFIFTNI